MCWALELQLGTNPGKACGSLHHHSLSKQWQAIWTWQWEECRMHPRPEHGIIGNQPISRFAPRSESAHVTQKHLPAQVLLPVDGATCRLQSIGSTIGLLLSRDLRMNLLNSKAGMVRKSQQCLGTKHYQDSTKYLQLHLHAPQGVSAAVPMLGPGAFFH